MEKENNWGFLEIQHSQKTVTGKSIVSVSTEKKFCRYCGTENKSDAVFCEKCGKKITEKDVDAEF